MGRPRNSDYDMEKKVPVSFSMYPSLIAQIKAAGGSPSKIAAAALQVWLAKRQMRIDEENKMRSLSGQPPV